MIRSLLFLMLCLLSCQAEDAAALDKLRGQFTGKSNTVMRPVREWYSQELGKLEKELTSKGRLDEALVVRKERAAMLLTSVEWTWDAGPAGKTKISFSMDGTGVHYYKKEKFAWSFAGEIVKLTYPDGRYAELEFDFKALTFKGMDFAGYKGLKGKAILQ